MRTEAEMFELILAYAREDDRIRAVVLNGSRVNPNMPADIFQDYDVIYFVDDLAPFIHNLSVIEYFGDTIIFQFPDEMGESQPQRRTRYAYLMQFTDGNRIDLTFCLLEDLDQTLKEDTLTQVLLDKDNRIAELPIPSDEGYLPAPPTEDQFDQCCNEFWWLMPYVAKGLWRGEIIGPKYYQEVLMRGELVKMLTWYCGIKTDFAKSTGKLGRFFEDYLDDDLWGMKKESFSDGNLLDIWKSVYTMEGLFRRVAQDVARHFGFSYPYQDDARVTEFVRTIKSLPPGASSFDP